MRTTDDSMPPSSPSPLPLSRSRLGPRPCPPRPPPPPPSRPPRRCGWRASLGAAGVACAADASGAACSGAGVSVGCCCCSSAIDLSVHLSGIAGPTSITTQLKFQTCFAGRFGQRLDPAVIHPPAAIEGDGGDTSGLAALGDRFAGGLGCGNVRAVLERATHFGAGGRDGGERSPGHVVDQLRVNVLA